MMHKTCSINYGHLADLQKTLPTTDLNKKIFHLIKYLLATFIFFLSFQSVLVSLLRWLYGSLTVGILLHIWYDNKMLSSQWDNNNQYFVYIIVSWYLLGIITRQGFFFSCSCMNRCTCPYIERCGFYSQVKIKKLLDLRARKLFWNAPWSWINVTKKLYQSCGLISWHDIWNQMLNPSRTLSETMQSAWRKFNITVTLTVDLLTSGGHLSVTDNIHCMDPPILLTERQGKSHCDPDIWPRPRAPNLFLLFLVPGGSHP